jgi:hypothetical protein
LYQHFSAKKQIVVPYLEGVDTELGYVRHVDDPLPDHWVIIRRLDVHRRRHFEVEAEMARKSVLLKRL